MLLKSGIGCTKVGNDFSSVMSMKSEFKKYIIAFVLDLGLMNQLIILTQKDI